MKPDFKFNKIEVNGVKITDTTVYLDDSTEEFVFKQFKSNEVYVIDIMEKHYINKESDYQFNITDSFGSSIFTNLLDG